MFIKQLLDINNLSQTELVYQRDLKNYIKIIILNKTKDIYDIYDLGSHTGVRKKILDNYQQYGIKNLNYNPAIFDSGSAKFVWVRHNYSGTLKYSENIKSNLKEYKFDLNKFYGK